jgi:hypothetical protein
MAPIDCVEHCAPTLTALNARRPLARILAARFGVDPAYTALHTATNEHEMRGPPSLSRLTGIASLG